MPQSKADDSTLPSADNPALLAGQVAYYRARAAEYDAWWYRTGRFDRGADNNRAWRADVSVVEGAVDTMLMKVRPPRVLELACGTGLFTRRIARFAGHVTAVDAAPEVIAINRERVAASNVEYVEADLFAWQPNSRYDCVFMSFWLSHVPHARFAAFWAMVRTALTPGGFACVIDSAHDPTSTAADHPTPDRRSGIVTRRLDDGREFRIVKIFYEPAPLTASLAALGFTARIGQTARYFIYGDVRDDGF